MSKKTNDLRSKTIEELRTDSQKLEKKLIDTTSEIMKGKEKNTSLAGILRKEFATLITILKEKEFLNAKEVNE